MKLGDSLLNEGAWLAARVAYEKEMFYNTLNIEKYNTLLLKKSYCFKAEGNFESAYQILSKASFYDGPDELRYKLYYEAALNAYLSGHPDLALSIAQEFSFAFNNSPDLLFIEVLVLNEMQKWQEASEKFLLYTEKNNLSDYESLYKEILNHKFKKEKRAESLSYFIPGSGQMYAGYFFRGSLSALIQGGLIYFSINSFLNGYYFSGTFTGVALFYMFYNGGARYAAKLAAKKNQSVVTAFNTKVREIIINTERIKKGG